MSLPRYTVFRVSADTLGPDILNRNFDAIKRVLDSMLDGGVVTNEIVVTVQIAGPKLVVHNLGRVANWEIVRQDGPGVLYEGALPAGIDPTKAVYLQPDGAGGNYTLRFS